VKTFSAKPHEVNHDWIVIDAADKILGRLASATHPHTAQQPIQLEIGVK